MKSVINDTVAILVTSLTSVNAEILNKSALKFQARAAEADS
jgi:hypothetical protein